MLLLCWGDESPIPCPPNLLADSIVLRDASECSDTESAAVPIPFSSWLVRSAERALNASPGTDLFAPPCPDPTETLLNLARLVILADFLNASKLEAACGRLASGAPQHAISGAWKHVERELHKRRSSPPRLRPRKKRPLESTDDAPLQYWRKRHSGKMDIKYCRTVHTVAPSVF